MKHIPFSDRAGIRTSLSKVSLAARRAAGDPVVAGALALAGLLVGIGSAQAAPQVPIPASLSQIQSNAINPVAAVEGKLAETRNLRMEAMRQAAQSYGARGGMLRRSYEIRTTLEMVAQKNDAIFNFAPLMLLDKQVGEGPDGRAKLIVPPVIVEATNSFNQVSDTVIRQRDETYTILTNARFSPVPMNWRTYLLRDLGEKTATPPHASLLPRSSEEKKDFDRWVAEGWEAGVEQANQIYRSDLSRMVRDIEGMVRYHRLVEDKVVSLPFVATRNDGVTGNDNELNVNDTLLRITVMPAFRLNPKDWNASGSKDAKDSKGAKR